MTRLGLFPNENQDSRDECEDGKQDAGGAEAESGNAHDADEDEVNGEQEHTDIFGDHCAILRLGQGLSRANRDFDGREWSTASGLSLNAERASRSGDLKSPLWWVGD
jgi:hypothetical protein